MDKPIILVVDDEPLISCVVEDTLRAAGFEVRSVLDAQAASAEVENLGTRLSAIVTDIRLGAGPNGWAVAVDARTQLPMVPVIYMTGDSAADWTAFGVQKKSVLVQSLSSVPRCSPPSPL